MEQHKFFVKTYTLNEDWSAGKQFATQWLSLKELEEVYFFTTDLLLNKVGGLVYNGPHIFGDYLKIVAVPPFVKIFSGGI